MVSSRQDVERTIEFILGNQAKTDVRLNGLTKIVSTVWADSETAEIITEKLTSGDTPAPEADGLVVPS